MTITGSSYFTYGSFSDNTLSYSIAGYGSLDYKKHYFLFAYENYLESWDNGDIRQHLVSLGYAHKLTHLIGLRTIGFYIFDSADNTAGILTNRLLYGYNPVFTLGYAISLYSRQLAGNSKYYTLHQINPDFRILLGNKVWLMPGLCYTNAEQSRPGGENYFSLLTKISINTAPYFSIDLGGMYGKSFYYVDDKLLIVNNRPNIAKSKVSIQFNYKVVRNFKLSLLWSFNSFDAYSVNYCAIGVEGII